MDLGGMDSSNNPRDLRMGDRLFDYLYMVAIVRGCSVAPFLLGAA